MELTLWFKTKENPLQRPVAMDIELLLVKPLEYIDF